MNISSYPSIYNLDHFAVKPLLGQVVDIEEKIDGSQISFSVNDGELSIKSKNRLIDQYDAGMFQNAVNSLTAVKDELHEGWTYRGEYLQKPKHNTLAYDRVPSHYVVVYDVQCGTEQYLSQSEKREECDRIKFECAPLYCTAVFNSSLDLDTFLDRESILGGKVEGIVIKPASRDIFSRDKKLLIAKYVCLKFREKNGAEWKNKTQKVDILTELSNVYRKEARWDKAIQHARDDGRLTNEMKDIGTIMRLIPEDILKECKEEIKDRLFQWAWPQLRKQVGYGFPEYYKSKLYKEE